MNETMRAVGGRPIDGSEEFAMLTLVPKQHV